MICGGLKVRLPSVVWLLVGDVANVSGGGVAQEWLHETSELLLKMLSSSATSADSTTITPVSLRESHGFYYNP